MKRKAFTGNSRSGYPPGLKRPRDWYRIDLFDEERSFFGTRKRLDNSYDGIGRIWNRGHMAQRADANRINEKYGCNTHVFANAVPQKAEMNQGIWLGLENYVSSLANKLGSVWVVSGPIYNSLSVIETIGEREKNEIPIGIPDEIFKVIFIEENENLRVFSLIFPNKYKEIPKEFLTGRCSRDKQYNYTSFFVSLSEIEKKSNLEFPISERYWDKNLVAMGLPEIKRTEAVGFCH
jgi:endonuclease G